MKDELAKVAGAEKWKVHDVDSATYGIKDSTAALLKYLSEIRKQAAIPGAIVLGSAHDVVQLGLFYLGVKFIRVRPRGDAKATFLAREVSPPLGRDLLEVRPVLRALRAC